MASGNLAKLHVIMRVKLSQGAKAERLEKEYERHDRELRKVRRFVRTMTSKGEFEIEFLKYFDAMYQWAQHIFFSVLTRRNILPVLIGLDIIHTFKAVFHKMCIQSI